MTYLGCYWKTPQSPIITTDHRILFFTLVFFSLLTIIAHFAFASPTLTLSPTSGPIGATVAASGSGYTPSVASSLITGGSNGGIENGYGHIIVNKFTSLLSNKQITNLGINIYSIARGDSSQGYGSNMGIDNGYAKVNVDKFIGLPPGATIKKLRFNVYDISIGSHSNVAGSAVGCANPFGNVYVEKFSIPVGAKISYFSIDAPFTPGGSLRVKVYQDNGTGGGPGTLLGESGAQRIALTGYQNYSISATADSPNTWVGFETNSSAACIYEGSGSGDVVSHTFGSGPNPFGVISGTSTAYGEIIYYTNPTPAVRLKVYQDDGTSGQPSTLLGESGPQVVSNTGFQNFTVSATVPASGNVWAGFESNTTTAYVTLSSTSSITDIASHTFGPGPSWFGTFSSWNSAPYEKLYYYSQQYNLGFTSDGSALSTSPATVPTNSTGGFSGVTFTVPRCGHLVNATDSSGKSANATFLVTGVQNILIGNVTNGAFTQTYKTSCGT